MMLHRSVTTLALALVALTSPAVVAQDCSDQLGSLATCIGINGLNCFSCGGALTAWASVTGECDGIGDICALVDCCAPCASPAIDYGECVLFDECDKNCDNVAPNAPSPAVPTPLFPSFNTPTAGDDGFSPECAAELNAYAGCFLVNTFACAASCIGDDDGTTEGFECSTIATSCDSIACCPPCLDASKKFIACEATVRGCSENCNAVQPVAPSPVAPFNFFPPAAPSPVGPVAPSVPGPCDDLTEAFALCFLQNLFTCGFDGPCLSLPEDSVITDPCGADRDLLCAPFICCAECANAGNAVASCALEAAGCPDTNCGEFAPIAPSPVAPFTFSPVAPSAPFTFSPFAPSAPFTFSPFAPLPFVTSDPVAIPTVTIAPISFAPVTVDAPVTGAPITMEPASSAPVTMEPASSAPVTMEPAPVTSAPATSVPDTPSSVTPSPVTPAPTDSGASHNMGVAAIMSAIIAVLCM